MKRIEFTEPKHPYTMSLHEGGLVFKFDSYLSWKECHDLDLFLREQLNRYFGKKNYGHEYATRSTDAKPT